MNFWWCRSICLMKKTKMSGWRNKKFLRLSLKLMVYKKQLWVVIRSLRTLEWYYWDWFILKPLCHNCFNNFNKWCVQNWNGKNFWILSTTNFWSFVGEKGTLYVWIQISWINYSQFYSCVDIVLRIRVENTRTFI
jgi:hypothetical protein